MSKTARAALTISFYAVILTVSLLFSQQSFSQTDISAQTSPESQSSQEMNDKTRGEINSAETFQSISAQAEVSPSLAEHDGMHSAMSSQKELTGPSSIFNILLNTINSFSINSGTRLKTLLASLHLILPDLYKVFINLSPSGTPQGALGNILLVILFISIGFIAQKFFRYLFFRYYYNFDESNSIVGDTTGKSLSTSEKLVSTLVKVAPDIVGIFTFAAVAALAYFIFNWTNSSFLQLFFLATLLTISLIRLVALCSNIVLSPAIPQFRILPMNCNTAKVLHGLVVWVGGYVIVALMTIVVIYQLGANETTIYVVRFLLATFTLFVTGIGVLLYKAPIRVQLMENDDEASHWARKRFANIWHILAIIYLIILWLLVLNTTIKTVSAAPVHMSPHAFIVSFFIVPIWLAADRLVVWIVRYLAKTLKIYDPSQPDIIGGDDENDQEKGKILYLKCKSAARTTLIFAFAIWLATLWGMSLPFLSKLAALVFDAAIIVFVALVFWQFISSWIESKIAESVPEETKEEDQDDEWGSTAKRGRAYTLLPMIRKFIASVLIVMVTMTILSSLGVHIGPLLAGAGVVGLAIGFGAQKLVADMFSGFFYLLDDAFRVGEYIEAGNVSGAVEDITLRNVMLRHHRGMLQIVPHSDLGSITNYMRGGIVVKFNLDFPYDADIDKIRKVIKKVGQAMLEDEELGKDFICPVKSQGVREISNSVMTIRVKFTAQPGTHFVIRREAFKRITEALQAKGIHYAHRKVIVDLPPTATSSTTDEQIQAAGAAAMQQIEEMEKKGSSGQQDGSAKNELL